MTVINTDHPQRPGGLLENHFKINWIFDARRDLVFLIGSVLMGWMIFWMYTILGWNMLLVWFVWVIVLDTPHFFATYSRTYLDREARREMPRLLILSLGVFLIGPALMAISYLLYAFEVSSYRLPWSPVFGMIVGLWAYWHVTRQHYGILRLYNRKNGETGSWDAKLDGWMLYGGLLIPFIALIARHPNARGRVGLDGGVPWFPAREEGQSVIGYLIDLRWEQGVVLLTIVALAGLIAVYVGRQIQRLALGEKIALPKLLFFAAVLPLHIYVCYSDAILATGLLTFTVIITIYHDCQYLAIVWYYNRNRYGGDREEAVKKYGFAARISKNFPLYLGVAILVFSLPVWAFGCLINRIPVCSYGERWGDPTIWGNSQTSWIVFFTVVTFGFQMHHYVLDQFIWRPSKSKTLREDLKVE